MYNNKMQIPAQINKSDLHTYTINGEVISEAALLTSKQFFKLKKMGLSNKFIEERKYIAPEALEQIFGTNDQLNSKEKENAKNEIKKNRQSKLPQGSFYIKDIPYPILVGNNSVTILYHTPNKTNPLPLLKNKIKKVTYYFEKPSKSIGEGSFGIVMIGQNLDDLNFYAVKNQIIELPFVHQIQHETKALDANHFLVDTANYRDNIYHIQQFIHGQNLELFYSHKYTHPLNIEEKINITLSSLRELKKLHQSGFLHNDIFLDNIMYNQEIQRCHLVDFGLVSEINQSSKKTLIGNPFYKAPEQLQQYTDKNKRSHYPYTEKTDIYALGLTFAVLFSNHLCDDGEVKQLYDHYKNTNHSNNNLKYINYFELKIPDIFNSKESDDTLNALYAVIRSMILINPEERPSLDECIKVVEDIKKQHKNATSTTSAPELTVKLHNIKNLLDSLCLVLNKDQQYLADVNNEDDAGKSRSLCNVYETTSSKSSIESDEHDAAYPRSNRARWESDKHDDAAYPRKNQARWGGY